MRPDEKGMGCGVGSLVALCLSVYTGGFSWWIIPHMILGWFYVVFWIIWRSGWVMGAPVVN